MKAGLDAKDGSQPTSPWTGLAWVRSTALVNHGGRGRSRPEAQRRRPIRITRRFSVAAPQVFAAWLEPEIAGRWLFATASHPMAQVQIDARVAGSFRFVDRRNGEITEYAGEYIEIVPPRRLAFTLSMERPSRVITRVMVEITPLKKGCELALTHSDVPRDFASHIEGRWTGILYGLGATLESNPLQSFAARSQS